MLLAVSLFCFICFDSSGLFALHLLHILTRVMQIALFKGCIFQCVSGLVPFFECRRLYRVIEKTISSTQHFFFFSSFFRHKNVFDVLTPLVFIPQTAVQISISRQKSTNIVLSSFFFFISLGLLLQSEKNIFFCVELVFNWHFYSLLGREMTKRRYIRSSDQTAILRDHGRSPTQDTMAEKWANWHPFRKTMCQEETKRQT